MHPARGSALIAVVGLGVAFLATPAAAQHVVPPPAGQVDIAPASQNLPARMAQLVSAGKGHGGVYLEEKSPGDLILSGVGNTRQANDVTAGISVVGDVVYLPEAPDGGSTPTQVTVHDSGAEFRVTVAPGERYLAGAGDHAVLLATPTLSGTTLTLRDNHGDRLVTTLPAGTLGHVTADATTVLLAFTPDGVSAPLIEAVSLADGTVSQVNTTALTAIAPLVAVSPAAFAWSDTGAVIRTARTGGSELRRVTTSDVTALAVLDDATGWNAGGDLFSAVLDEAVDPLDHGVVSNPGVIAPAYGPTYGAGFTVVGEDAGYLSLEQFSVTQTARMYFQALDRLDAVVSDLRLNAGKLIIFQNSATPGVPTFPFHLQDGAINGQPYGNAVGVSSSRRLTAFSGRFQATGSADDTTVTLSTGEMSENATAPGPNLTVPVSRGVDTIELSGYRLLVHRPGSARSQLYTLGSPTPADYPLVASIFGARVAWLNPDGSIQTRDVTSGATTTARPAGTSVCTGPAQLAGTTLRVAGDEVFWSLCGQNRVHRIAADIDLVLPDGDMTNARLGTGALAVLDPVTRVLSVTDVDTGASYPVAAATVAFDIDDRFVAWADKGNSHLAPLPFDNTDVPPQVVAEWGDTTIVPTDFSPTRRLMFWRHQADLTQPASATLRIPGVNYHFTPAGTSYWDSYWPGSFSVSWDGQDYHSSAEPAATPGPYPWSITAVPGMPPTNPYAPAPTAPGPAATLAGTLTVRDQRVVQTIVTSSPKTLVAGTRGTLNVKLFVGYDGALPAAPVVVTTRPRGTSAWKTVGRFTTTATGTLAYPVAPTNNSEYRFLYPGGTYGPASSLSALATVLVIPKVTLKASATSVRTGTVVVLAGSVWPAKPGQVVSVQKFSAGAWHTTANVKLNNASGYRISLRATKGSVSYRVLRTADGSNAAGTSPIVVLRGS